MQQKTQASWKLPKIAAMFFGHLDQQHLCLRRKLRLGAP
jgi:hypothetical protein